MKKLLMPVLISPSWLLANIGFWRLGASTLTGDSSRDALPPPLAQDQRYGWHGCLRSRRIWSELHARDRRAEGLCMASLRRGANV
jgi:hypothetical protein